MGGRYPNPRLVKMHRNYDTIELSKLLGIHKNTLRNWAKMGLRLIDEGKPALFLGIMVKEFLTERRQKKHQTCRRDEIYCLVCRSPKIPDGEMVDYLPLTPRSGNLRGLCPDCGNLIHRCIAVAKLSTILTVFHVAYPQGLLRIEDTRDPRVNCESDERAVTHDKLQRLKRSYLVYLKEAKRHDDSTLDGVTKAIHRFESYTKFRDFRNFRIEQAVGFKHHMAGLANLRTGKPLSKATLHQTLNALKNFFRWLAGQPGFRSRLSYPDADNFYLSEKEARIATAHRQGAVPTLEQIHFTLAPMPSGTDIEKRNRALLALTI